MRRKIEDAKELKVEICFLLGPAGSGKTYECLEGIRRELCAAPEGDPIIFLAPRQATFQLERQLLQDGELKGYSRLNILSFERLARWVFEHLRKPIPRLLSEEGRVMVLRALITEQAGNLSIFKTCAFRAGFASELSEQIREFQNHGVGPAQLREWARMEVKSDRLRAKLRDLALIYSCYLTWLSEGNLQDADALIGSAADLLMAEGKAEELKIGMLYVDGFAQFTPEERRFLFAVPRFCQSSTLAFCLEGEEAPASLLSNWTTLHRTYQQCLTEAEALTPGKVKTRILQRNAERSRFSKSASLGHLERCWNSPLAYEREVDIHLIECADPRAETIFCAREINRHARAGGRYREVAVIARNFENDYPHLLRQTFRKYEIPYFLDHRENVAHHPLAELTRGALRTVANHWKRRDWISALKSGLIHSDTDLLDKLENEALARGWEGEVWLKGFTIHKKPELEKEMNQLRAKLVKPMTRFQEALGSRPNGPELASALEALWLELEVEKQLENWRDNPGDTVHQTVWTQAQEWVENLRLAFPRQRWSIREWVLIVEAGLDGLSVGVIPPALDQVLVGRVDRSRNPDLKKLFVLGFNEGIFPAPPGQHSLLSEHDRDALRELGRELSNTPALRIGEEQFFGYIACSRAREKLCISWSKAGADGKAINPSRFVSHIKRIFPSLNAEFWNAPGFLAEVEHLCELGALRDGELAPEPDMKERLEKKLALNLYGRELGVSISSMEKFAMCPFRFFLEKGLGLEERVEFELDAREQGSFQHEVLSRFHEDLKAEGKLWREIGAPPARISLRPSRSPNFNSAL